MISTRMNARNTPTEDARGSPDDSSRIQSSKFGKWMQYFAVALFVSSKIVEPPLEGSMPAYKTC